MNIPSQSFLSLVSVDVRVSGKKGKMRASPFVSVALSDPGDLESVTYGSVPSPNPANTVWLSKPSSIC